MHVLLNILNYKIKLMLCLEMAFKNIVWNYLEVCVWCSGPRLGALGGELAVLVVGVKQTIHCVLIVAAFNHRAGEGWNLVNPTTLSATSIQALVAMLVPIAENTRSSLTCTYRYCTFEALQWVVRGCEACSKQINTNTHILNMTFGSDRQTDMI